MVETSLPAEVRLFTRRHLIFCALICCPALSFSPAAAKFPLTPTAITPGQLRADAMAEYLRGNIDAALDIYEQAVDIAKKQYGPTAVYVGDLYFEMGSIALKDAKFPRAESYLAEAVKVKPNSPTVRAKLVDLLLLRGRPDEARDHAKKAVIKHPDSLEARQAYAEALNHSGQVAGAALAYAHFDAVRHGQRAPVPSLPAPPKPAPPPPPPEGTTPAAAEAGEPAPNKPEAKKPEPKKSEVKKPEPKKPESKKPPPRKVEPKKPAAKPPEAKPKVEAKKKEPKPPAKPPAPPPEKPKPAEKPQEMKAKPLELKAKPLELKGLPPKPAVPAKPAEAKPKTKIPPGMVPPPPPVVPSFGGGFVPPPPPMLGAPPPAPKQEPKPKPKPKEPAKEESSHGGGADDDDFLLDWSGVEKKKKKKTAE